METFIYTTFTIVVCGLAAVAIVNYFNKYED